MRNYQRLSFYGALAVFKLAFTGAGVVNCSSASRGRRRLERAGRALCASMAAGAVRVNSPGLDVHRHGHGASC